MKYFLLSEPHQNAKTKKALARGYYTPGLHLAPWTYSGYQTCPKANGCQDTCLFFSGNGRFPKVPQAQIRRTELFFENRRRFMELLDVDIQVAQIVARHMRMLLASRLNIYSDLPWEKIRTADGQRSLMHKYSDIQFYDYTKVVNRRTPDNYHLTISDDLSQLPDRNVALIWDSSLILPDYPIIDGDEHDLRFLDPAPCIVKLKRKRVFVSAFTLAA